MTDEERHRVQELIDAIEVKESILSPYQETERCRAVAASLQELIDAIKEEKIILSPVELEEKANEFWLLAQALRFDVIHELVDFPRMSYIAQFIRDGKEIVPLKELYLALCRVSGETPNIWGLDLVAMVERRNSRLKTPRQHGPQDGAS